MKPDMSPQAVGRRLRKVGELVQLCRALRIKPGSVRPVVGALQEPESQRNDGQGNGTDSFDHDSPDTALVHGPHARPILGVAAAHELESPPRSVGGGDVPARQLEPPDRQAREQPET